jgi:purine-binding chemotaxis protein CheW
VTSSPSETTPVAAAQEYLTFFIAGEEYAVSLEFVREVIPYDTVTRVPGMPEAVRGVTNLRGSVVPVVDLALKFRLPEVPVSARTCIVLVETILDGREVFMGLVTEQVGQVLGLAAGELLPAPSFGAPVRTDFLLGMAPVGKKFALVLDIRRVLSPHELLRDTTAEVVPAPEARVEHGA